MLKMKSGLDTTPENAKRAPFGPSSWPRAFPVPTRLELVDKSCCGEFQGYLQSSDQNSDQVAENKAFYKSIPVKLLKESKTERQVAQLVGTLGLWRSFILLVVRERRLELLPLAGLDPKSSASTNSATLAQGVFLWFSGGLSRPYGPRKAC